MTEAPRPTTEQELDAYAYAVWMVGNMDTAEDKAAWWRDFQTTWDAAARRVERMHERGLEVGAGFGATGLPVPRSPGMRPPAEPGPDGVPLAAHVAGVLEDLGGSATAAELRDALMAYGASARQAQLAIQRTTDAGDIENGRDWRIRLPG